ncbi:Gamma-tubulin complex component 4 homolog [Linum grandiflorum]
MLHELLLALLGYTGDLVVDERDQQSSLGVNFSPEPPISDHRSFKLAPDLSFLHPSDRDLVERIISLGFYYRELDRFASKSRNLSCVRSSYASPVAELSSNGTEKEKHSVYRRAIANGIVEILSIYRSAVLHIEQKLLSETVPILATLTQGLNKFFVLLPPLYELVLEIERENVRGGQLLTLLHKRCHCGVPELQTCIQRLLWHGHQVMYNQLASWMVYGILQDHHGEFFIRRLERKDEKHSSSDHETSERYIRMSADDASLTDWHSGFDTCLDMLPSYIPTNIADSILFAGKAIRILRNPSPAFLYKDPSDNQQVKGGRKVHEFMGQFSIHEEPFMTTSHNGEELLPHSEADKIEVMLKDLKCRTHLNFTKDCSKVLLDASELLQLVIFGSLWLCVLT